MGNGKQIVFVVLLTTFVQSKSVYLNSIPESAIEFAVEQAKLRGIEEFTLPKDVDCTAAGIFVINCTSFKLCVEVGGGIYIGAEATCLFQQNFNPDTKMCDPDYVCPLCTREGFVCLTNTSFTLCSDILEVVVNNVTCPDNHCCHEAYRLPCMNKTLACHC